MSLETSSSLVDYLKADTNDAATIDAFLTGSINMIENYLNTTITAASQSDQFNAPSVRDFSYPNQLLLRCYPVVSSSVVITSLFGAALYNYQIDSDRGIIQNSIVRPYAFPEYTIFGANYPYVVTYVAGLQTAADYSTRYEPILNECIREIVADWYYSRNPRVASESETGTSNTYFNTDIAPRTKALLNLLKRKPR